MGTIDEAASRDSALEEPTVPVGRRWIGSWTAALFGMYMAYYAGAQIVLPKQAEAIAGTGKVALLAWVTGVAAIVTIIGVLLVGALSDRTLAQRGRRQPWVLAGAVLTGLAVAGQGLATTAVAMVLIWAVANLGISAMTGALFAAVPDEVPVGQRAWVSSFYGNAVAAGPLLGIALVALVVTDVVPAFVALGVVALLLGLPYALGTRSTPLRPAERPPFTLRTVTAGVFTPLRHADFAWAWSGRFLIQLSNALAQVFLYFYLHDFIGYPDPEVGTFILAAIYTAGVLVAAAPAGRISDRTMRRKRMVVISSVLQGIAGLIMAFVPTFTAAAVASLVLGLGYGAYAAVDQALITQVLPSAADRGKDLAVINIANVLPYAVTGVLGAAVIELWGYPGLNILVLITAVLAAITVQPIKAVR
ncbi:MFS transporter [Pseudonocardia sp. TRM90224]|uniref:MFS transporter n=1 Tax=Pseudonocardia sp. TRM90224 TaxID=2812678 RepID=UPI001E5B60F5|nr:MFS transporter [Pseudonocardia sp. TRM90224]